MLELKQLNNPFGQAGYGPDISNGASKGTFRAFHQAPRGC